MSVMHGSCRSMVLNSHRTKVRYTTNGTSTYTVAISTMNPAGGTFGALILVSPILSSVWTLWLTHQIMYMCGVSTLCGTKPIMNMRWRSEIGRIQTTFTLMRSSVIHAIRTVL